MPIFVLEVIRFFPSSQEIYSFIDGKEEHVGYMKAKFKTKEDACSYYNRNNLHMRKLNAHGDYKSDWDPITKLLYIVRKDYDLIDKIHPFSLDDLPINSIYKYLK